MIRIEAISSFRQLGPRNNQEDWLMPETPSSTDRVLVLCDGMGGHGHGEVASQTVAEAVYQYLHNLNAAEYTAADIQAAADCASVALHQRNVVDSERTMGTTLVVAVFNKMRLLVGHVGDSRAYLFDSDGRIKFRTRDHSRVAEAVEAGILTEEEAFNSPYKNQITRALMADTDHIDVDIDELIVENGDILMLCSDGVNDCLRDRQLEEVFVAFDFVGAAESLRSQCEVASGDNNTAIVAQLQQDEPNVEIRSTHESIPHDAGRQDEHNTADTCEGNERCACDHPAFCPNCGAPLEPCVRFCPRCGQEISRRSTCRFCSALDRGLEIIENGIHSLRRKISGNIVD